MSEWTDEERAIIVTAREHLRYIDGLEEKHRTYAIMGVPEAEWGRLYEWGERTLAAIKADRQSEDYARDPDAVNPPSRAHLLLPHGGQACPGPGCGVPGKGDGADGQRLRPVAADEPRGTARLDR